jgi:hypothetical protein
MKRAIKIDGLCAFLFLAAFACGLPAYGEGGQSEGAERTSPLAGSSENRIVAFGDVHGGADELRALLRALTLIDESDSWTGGQTRLVSLGDLLDRGPDSRAVMDLLMKLEIQAEASGGAVHLVLGNHELMNLTGDLRYVSEAEYAAFRNDEDAAERAEAFAQFEADLAAAAAPKKQTHTRIKQPKEPKVDARAQFEEKFPPGYFAHRAAFAADGAYGSWLLGKPQILELDGIAFVHGGLSDEFVDREIDNYNQQATDELRALLSAGTRLVDAGRLSPRQDLVTGRPADGLALPADFNALRSALQFDPSGPAWYRGTAGCHTLIEQPRFDAVLEARGLARIVMGHTPTNPRIIQTRFDGRAVLADTGMYADYYRGLPSAAIFSAGAMRAVTLLADGTLSEQLGQPAIDLRTGGEQTWLENAARALGELELKPDRTVSFEANGRRLEAVWHKDSRREQSARLAAFALDKLLGFGLVAPVLRIEQEGRAAVAEILPATSLSETSRLTGNVFRPNYCKNGSDFDLLIVLDALMGQERNGDNLAYDRVTWLIYLTEQHKAFPRQARLPRYLAEQSIVLPPLVAEKLRRLDLEMLSSVLADYLDDRQIKAILDRRDLVLARWPEAG